MHWVLAVCIALHRDVISVLDGIFIAGLNRTADPHIERELNEIYAFVSLYNLDGIVGRSVINYEYVVLRCLFAECREYIGDRFRFIERRCFLLERRRRLCFRLKPLLKFASRLRQSR